MVQDTVEILNSLKNNISIKHSIPLLLAELFTNALNHPNTIGTQHSITDPQGNSHRDKIHTPRERESTDQTAKDMREENVQPLMSVGGLRRSYEPSLELALLI